MDEHAKTIEDQTGVNPGLGYVVECMAVQTFGRRLIGFRPGERWEPENDG